MSNNSTIKAVVWLGIALLLVVGIFVAARDENLESGEKRATGELPSDGIPFSPYQKNGRVQAPTQNPSLYPTPPSIPLENPTQNIGPTPADKPPTSTANPGAGAGDNNEPGPTPPSSQPNYILPLPAVAQAELSIDSNGATNFPTYADQLVSLVMNPTFPVEKYNSILKDERGIPLSPERLIEKAIAEKNFSQIQNSLTITEELVQHKIEKFKEFKVRDQGATINAMVIGFEKLTLEMLGQAKKVALGELDQASFESYYQKYNQSVSYYYDRFASFYGGISSLEKETLWGKFADTLGLRKVAYAIGFLPFGGIISVTIPCICSLGMTIYVSPPVAGRFFISPFASRIFANFKPIPSSWILGNHAPAPVPCLQFVLVGCAPQPGGENQGLVIIAGTS